MFSEYSSVVHDQSWKDYKNTAGLTVLRDDEVVKAVGDKLFSSSQTISAKVAYWPVLNRYHCFSRK